MKKTALITGASSGIGYELAIIHAQQGDNIILVARNIGKLLELKDYLEKTYRISAITIEKDLSRIGSAAELYAELKKNNIDIDFLINNAGFGDYGFFHESDWPRQEQMINLNITSLVQLTRLILPDMVSKRGGKIMNVASTAAFQPGPLMAVYYATKAFVLSFSEAINNEVYEFGVTVTALCPGPTASGFQAVAAIEDSKLVKGKKLPSSKDVAKYAYYAMMKGKPVAIHGLLNRILASSVRFTPRSIIVKAVRKIQEK